MPWWLGTTTVLAFATMAVAAQAPRPARRPAGVVLLALLLAQPVSLLAGLVIWPVAGAAASAALGMVGISCMLVAVWLMPRDDPGNGSPGDDDDGGGGPPDDGPGGLDWAQFDRLRRQWAAEALQGVTR